MFDTKVILALALLLGTAMGSLKEAPEKPPAGGIPVPPPVNRSWKFSISYDDATSAYV